MRICFNVQVFILRILSLAIILLLTRNFTSLNSLSNIINLLDNCFFLLDTHDGNLFLSLFTFLHLFLFLKLYWAKSCLNIIHTLMCRCSFVVAIDIYIFLAIYAPKLCCIVFIIHWGVYNNSWHIMTIIIVLILSWDHSVIIEIIIIFVLLNLQILYLWR